jgi:rRNA-processing protein FCF1
MEINRMGKDRLSPFDIRLWSTMQMMYEKKEREWPKILFDSSMLIGVFESRIDPIAEIERVLSTRFDPIVLSGTLAELRDVLQRSRGGKRRKLLALALQAAEKFNKLDYFPVDDEEMDDTLLRAAKDLGAVVATNDHGLRKRLAIAGIPVLFIRQKSHIEVDGDLGNFGVVP